MVKTAGEWSSWALLAGLAGLTASSPFACKPPSTQAPHPFESEIRTVLASVGPEIVLPVLERFSAATEQLEATTVQWETTLVEGGDPDGARTAAQEAWWNAMVIWQEAELLQVGPAGSSLTTVGGQDLRDEIYSWPTINPCRVDQETVESDWDESNFFDQNLVNSYGLDALEHLLYADEDNACPSQVDINADGTWDALGSDQIALNRAAFAIALIHQLQHNTDTLLNAWGADGDNFSETLATAGEDGPYDNVLHGLNAIFDAMFYLELLTEDRKLAMPLGLQDCGTATCLDAVESMASGGSLSWLRANLVGFSLLFTGGDGVGMNDLLEEMGHGDLATLIDDAVPLVLNALEGIEGPLDVAIVNQRDEVDALYAALQHLTDLLKGDLATVLTLQIPSEAAGDND